MYLLLVALGAFFVTEFVKTLLGLMDQVMHAWLKLTLAGVVAGLLAWALHGWSEDTVILGLAGGGLAALAHKVHRMTSAVGDSQQVAVMAKASPRRF